ncbi:hypothetical protein SLEP1_g1493 [Rubroshorea leprosula]|uniref:Uncharacterized protein n=1 Tax=Rubroshorea leprosula TaxID=152421 RepID=A0AAV5HDY7_9ROSI|nr:hypothetical protein SLEP1_g1493 [Rubroshorea leprosula]
MAKIKPQALLLQSKKKKGPNRISLTSIILSSLILVLTLYFLYATYRHWSPRSGMQMKSKAPVFKGDNSFVNMKKSNIPRFGVSFFVCQAGFSLQDSFFLASVCL